MELRRVIRITTAVIAVSALTASSSLVLVTSYLHRLTDRIDANLQSVRAAEEIQLQLLWHSRNANQAALMSAPERETIAAQARAEVLQWFETAGHYVGSEDEGTILRSLGRELEAYFAAQDELAAADLSGLERYAGAVALFDRAYALAEELLNTNLAQAAAATAQAATWDRISTVIGFSVAFTMLVVAVSLIAGAHLVIYRPLLSLGDAIRRYPARGETPRAKELGPSEIRDIAGAFNEMTEQLERQRSRQLVFVASVAHDLRNPLAAMKAAVDTIAVTRDPSALGSLTAVMSRQIDALVRMISDLLDAARIEAGQFTLVPAEHDARTLVQDAVALFRGVSACHELITDVPETPLPVVCDSARINQVINNLLSNAIKYSPHGGRVKTRVAASNNGVAIEVSDHGLGIPADELAGIFEPFRRGRSRTPFIKGVGIGLAVTRGIVQAHGGTISVHSAVGTGSTFAIWLPKGAAQDEDAEREQDSSDADEPWNPRAPQSRERSSQSGRAAI